MSYTFIISINGMDFDTLEAAVNIARMMNVECDIIERWYDEFTGKYGDKIVATFRN